MLGFARRSPFTPGPRGLLAVRRGSALLADHTRRLARIRSLVGVPARHWRLLYEALFVTYAEYVQQIPVPETSENVESGPLLRHALERVERALKVRRGYILPPGKEPEIVANEQDVWTYSVATAALLGGSGKVLLDQRVMLHDRDRRPVHVWNPWTGPITRTGSPYYRVDYRPSTHRALAHSAVPLLVTHILPADGLRWLASHEDALAMWLATISAHAPNPTVVNDIIRNASQASAAMPVPEDSVAAAPGGPTDDPESESNGDSARPADRPLREHVTEAAQSETVVAESATIDPDDLIAIQKGSRGTAPSSDPHVDDPSEAFLQWLINGIVSGVLAINSAKAHLHVVDRGLLLASPAVFRAFARENWPDVQKRFLKRKLTEKTASGENIFQYWRVDERGRKTIKGMLMARPEERLGVPLPASDSRLVPKHDCP